MRELEIDIHVYIKKRKRTRPRYIHTVSAVLVFEMQLSRSKLCRFHMLQGWGEQTNNKYRYIHIYTPLLCLYQCIYICIFERVI